MKRLPRLLPCVALACSLAMPMLSAPLAWASPAGQQAKPPAGGDAAAPPAGDATTPPPAGTPQTAPPTSAPAGAAPAGAAPATTEPAMPEVGANQSLADQVDDFWHYGEIGRYDIQAALGNKIIAAGQQNPEELLKAFEAIADRHHLPSGAPSDMDTALLRWQSADPKMRTVATQVIDLLNKGRFARRQNPEFIAQNIARLSGGERAYSLAMQQIRNSGELAVPQLVAILVSQKPEDLPNKDVARRALIDLGRSALNPLLAATQMDPKDPALTTICAVLGQITYQRSPAIPYLVGLTNNPAASAQVREAASAALHNLPGASTNANAGDLFYSLAETFYYGNGAIQPDPRSPKAFIWFWVDRGLSYKAVPPQIFNDIMTMRETEHALRQNPAPSAPEQSVALWLAANIRRGIDLPAGQTDPTRGAEEPQPHYYNVAEGAQYLNLVLSRSLTDNTPASGAVALAAIKSLQGIVGQSNLFSGNRGEPLVQAMRYPDRQVRFEAAFALAAALPQRPFQGSDMVVPLLAEAVTQSGMPGVLIIGPQADRARIAADLKNYATAGGNDAAGAVAESSSIPAVDVILMSEDMGNPEVSHAIDLASQNPRLAHAAKLIIVHSLASPWARLSLTDPTISYTQATGGESLINSIEQARKKAGGIPMDAKSASDFSLRAANLLAKLAISRGQVFNLTVAEPMLLSALGDKRPEIVSAVGDAVALINSPRAQGALADRAADAKTPPDIRISLYRSLALSAKFHGAHLDANQVNELQQVVTGEKNLDIRSAAAEARGALNLPAQAVQSLILQRND
jgi:hypothetical protein